MVPVTRIITVGLLPTKVAVGWGLKHPYGNSTWVKVYLVTLPHPNRTICVTSTWVVYQDRLGYTITIPHLIPHPKVGTHSGFKLVKGSGKTVVVVFTK